MRWRHKRRELHGVMGGLGLVAAPDGLVGWWYSSGTAVVLAFGARIVGAIVANLPASHRRCSGGT